MKLFAANTSGLLPGFLLGDQPNPRSSAFSPPKKTFANSPTTSTMHQYHMYASPTQETNPLSRSPFGSVTPVGSQQQQQQSKLFKYHPTSHDASINAPPTIGLFDSLREERSQTPIKGIPSGITAGGNLITQQYQAASDSYINNSGFNYSRVMSPIQNMSQNEMDPITNRIKSSYNNFWVTVFGFPPSSVSLILSHFSQCGTIVDKAFSSQNGNWIHLRFSSRIECDKALNYNGKIVANSLMIGVIPCTDPNIMNDEAGKEDREPRTKIRSLSRVAFETTENPMNVEPNAFAPKLNTGIVSKAMDLFFGW